MRYTDRSRVLKYQSCPRARYWGYEHGGRGVAKKALNVPLATGACTHEGLADLLTQVKQSGLPADTDQAVGVALKAYQSMVEGRDLDVEANDQIEFTYNEQRALTEALIRMYAVRGLPRLVEEHEILEVEQEDLMPLTVGIEWQSRADGLLRERDSGDLYVLSFKTAAKWDQRSEAKANHDMQGLSEAAAVNYRFAQLGDPRKVFGVKMEHLIKGLRQKDDAGVYRQSSPLIVGYRKMEQGITEDSWSYAWSPYYTCSEPHPMRKSKYYPTGMCEGGRRHKLSDGYEKFNVWEEPGGVKWWLELLASGQVQPDAGDCLGAQLITPIPYFRDDAQIEDWRESVTEQEGRVAMAMADPAAGSRSHLNRFFPKHSDHCDWPSKCPFQDICWGTVADPIASGGFVWRRPHHEPELRAMGDE